MKANNKPRGEGGPGPRRLYKTKEVAKVWNISTNKIYGLVGLGKLRPIVNMGKGWMWTGDEFGEDDDFFERL
ncbi:MAG: helix-turn-helix domain-containing protein [Luteolibacter sp.]|nr:helix-turn-helix domain-containing protein [Luteolibacter sp.]